MKVVAVVLAAGEASRFGKTKQLLAWDKSTLVGNACSTVLQAGIQHVIVVTGAAHEQVEAVLPKGVLAVNNANWQEGIHCSLVLGVEAAFQQFDDLQGLLVCLADQPFVDRTLIVQFLAAFRQSCLVKTTDANAPGAVALAYPSGPGVPCLFSRKLTQQLLTDKLTGGAKTLLRKAANHVILIENKDARIDIDTEEDYRLALEKFAARHKR